MKFEIEFAQYTKVIVEAESREDAETMAAVMDEDDIAEHDPHEYDIWNIRKIN